MRLEQRSYEKGGATGITTGNFAEFLPDFGNPSGSIVDGVSQPLSVGVGFVPDAVKRISRSLSGGLAGPARAFLNRCLGFVAPEVGGGFDTYDAITALPNGAPVVPAYKYSTTGNLQLQEAVGGGRMNMPCFSALYKPNEEGTYELFDGTNHQEIVLDKDPAFSWNARSAARRFGERLGILSRPPEPTSKEFAQGVLRNLVKGPFNDASKYSKGRLAGIRVLLQTIEALIGSGAISERVLPQQLQQPRLTQVLERVNAEYKARFVGGTLEPVTRRFLTKATPFWGSELPDISTELGLEPRIPDVQRVANREEDIRMGGRNQAQLGNLPTPKIVSGASIKVGHKK